MGCCVCKPIKLRKNNDNNYDKDTFINPIYIEEEEPPPKIKLNRKSKEEYYNDAKDYLKDLDHFLDSS